MPNLQNSALLSRILEKAENLCRENECRGLSRDYIIVAAISVLDQSAVPAEKEEGFDEFKNARELLSGLSRDGKLLQEVLEKRRQKEVPANEKILLTAVVNPAAQRSAREANLTLMPADLYLKAILQSEIPAIASLRKQPAASAQKKAAAGETEPEEKRAEAEDAAGEKEEFSLDRLVRTAKALQDGLKREVFGQDQAVNMFVSGFFQSRLRRAMSPEQKGPSAIFLFAGPPGVGKTFLAETAAKLLHTEAKRFDMSGFSGPSANYELTGHNKSFQAAREGALTGFVRKKPASILLFDEIEKTSIEVIHLFLQILDAGQLRDNYLEKDVSFKDTILIFTTNAGKSLYESDAPGKLSSLSRDVILDALSKDVNPATREPFFPPAICSRFASGNVIMFNRLEAADLRMIVEKRLGEHAEDLQRTAGIAMDIGKNIPTALLFAEGASVDARTVKSRTDSFFSGELYELFRLITSEAVGGNADSIRRISVSVDPEKERDEVRRLFFPDEKVHALFYSERELSVEGSGPLFPEIHFARTPGEARKILRTENIGMAFCDLIGKEGRRTQRLLNLEDVASDARDFFREILRMHPDIPVILTESPEEPLRDEERISFLRSGAAGFLSLEAEGLSERIERFSERIFQQHCMNELARGNRLLRFETYQTLSPDGNEAAIGLFDLSLEKAVKAGDRDSVMSMLSAPDVKFEDVIGAKSAKEELQFFISFMRDPKSSVRRGASAPKGILLYGPPGTGKTMLAKAFAAESGATFIAAQGNQFHKTFVGQGQEMVHSIFAAARRYAPSVIFIDEIDSIGSVRTSAFGSGSEHSHQEVLTALLAEMDGFDEHRDKAVFVLGATNYGVDPDSPLKLDPAFLRRFDRRILVDLPDLEDRKEYLKKMIGAKEIFSAVSDNAVESIADRSTGMSLAQLSSVLDLAVRSALRKGADAVDDALLEESFETFNSGEEKKWDSETVLCTARHEAGHTLISFLQGETPSYVTVTSRGDYGGYMQHANREKKMTSSRRDIMAQIRTALGGRAAEIVYYGREDGLSSGAVSDLRNATARAEQMLRFFGMDEEFGLAYIDDPSDPEKALIRSRVNAILKEELETAIRQISENRAKLDALVEALVASGSLKKADIERILGA